ncbi:hypothetical protein OO009_04820 [Flavobacteriaceae bacterium KMM 6897]|nr:hypothetical protein [Flavobacteriaceae bacterium KMM 6897]MEB8345859.1 hypothetical protein [Flavobacteriaceae bacterium KMM 6898]
MKKKRIFFIIGLFLVTIVFLSYYVLSGRHRNISKEDPTITLKAIELHNPFKNNNSHIASSYIDKVAQVTGRLTDITGKTLELDYMIQVDLTDSLSTSLDMGMMVTIKGRCVGYDDMLEVVKIDQAIILLK